MLTIRHSRAILLATACTALAGCAAAHQIYTPMNAGQGAYNVSAVSEEEQLLERNPDNVKGWVKYIHEVADPAGVSAAANRASRHALSLFPGNPHLLLARARIFHNAEALNSLDQLAKIKGYRRNARRMALFVRAGMWIPLRRYNQAPSYELLIDRLAEAHCKKLAQRYLAAALKMFHASERWPFLARKAIFLAEAGKLREALAVEKQAHFLQCHMEGGNWGVADVLLKKNKPALAVESFGGKVPPRKGLASYRRTLLGIAYCDIRRFHSALNLLHGKFWGTQLPRLYVLLKAGHQIRAKALGRQIVTPLQLIFAAYGGPYMENYGGPTVLRRACNSAVRWLLAHFPGHKQAILINLGTGHKILIRNPWWRPFHLINPPAERIARLRAQLAGSSGAQADAVRRKLSATYARFGHDAAAATVLAPLVSQGDRDPQMLSDAYAWDVRMRRALAMAVSARHFWRVATARDLTDAWAAHNYDDPKRNGKRWMPRPQILSGLISIGGPALAGAIKSLWLNAGSDANRQPWILIIRRVGARQDVPALLTAIQTIHQAREYLTPRGKQNLGSAASLYAALAHLTGAHPRGKGTRLKRWENWWARHAAKIVARAQRREQ